MYLRLPFRAFALATLVAVPSPVHAATAKDWCERFFSAFRSRSAKVTDTAAGPAVAVEKNATIYLDSSTEIGDEPHRRRTLHHEFFHFIDYAMHGERDIRDNREWVAAGAPGSTYGAAENGAPVANWASHPAAGFVSNYAKKAVPEDRAELFCAIMTNNLTVRLLLQKDSFLTAKLNVLKGELKEFCPQIDEAFWAKTAKNF